MLIPFRCMQWQNCDGFRVVLCRFNVCLFRWPSLCRMLSEFNWFEMHMLFVCWMCANWTVDSSEDNLKFLRPNGPFDFNFSIACFQSRLKHIGSLYVLSLFLQPMIWWAMWSIIFSFYLANWIWLNNESSFNSYLMDGCVSYSQNGGSFFFLSTHKAKEVAQQARIKTKRNP